MTLPCEQLLKATLVAQRFQGDAELAVERRMRSLAWENLISVRTCLVDHPCRLCAPHPLHRARRLPAANSAPSLADRSSAGIPLIGKWLPGMRLDAGLECAAQPRHFSLIALLVAHCIPPAGGRRLND